MDANGLKFWMLCQQQDWHLPRAPVSTGASAANASSLSLSVGAGDTQIVLLTPLPGGALDFVSIDSEIMSVSAIDPTGLQLAVTRGALGTLATNHPPGALVLGPVGILNANAAADDTQINVIAALPPPITTAPVTTPAPTSTPAMTTTPAPTTTAAALPVAVPAGLSSGALLQIGPEVLVVTAVNWTGMVLTVTRGALGTSPAAYSAGTPIFAPFVGNTLYYCPTTKRLQLLSMRLGNPPFESFPAAAGLVETVPQTRDTFGNYARWSPVLWKVMAGGSEPGEDKIYEAPAGQAVTDLAMGYDGILYIAVGGTLVLVDRRGRWPDFTLTVPGFTFWRLAALPEGGVLALDRTKPQLGKVTGALLQTGPVDIPNPGIMRSCQANPNPPQMVATYPLPAGETFVGLAAADKKFVLLSWAASSSSNTSSYLRLFDCKSGVTTPWKLKSILWPYSLAWLGNATVAVLATGLNEALVFNLAEGGTTLLATGDSYVLPGTNSGPFAHTLGQPPYYAAGTPLLTPVSLQIGTATVALTSLAAGPHRMQALYRGDTSNPAQASAVLVQNVASSSNTVTLSSSQNPSLPGNAVTFTATISPPAATGTVQFLDGTVVLGTVTISGGVTTLAVSTLAVGEHSITAAYSGDAGHPAQTSTFLVQSVAAASAAVTLTSSPNPSTAGQPVTLTATVSPSTATGSVQFLDGEQLFPLLPLSLNSLAGFGSTDPQLPTILDSGISQAAWHRMFLEAVLPPRCSAVVWLTAAESRSGISSPVAAWYPHAFGDADMTALPAQTPQATWLSIPSEVPFAKPLLGEAPTKDLQGLFMVLVQRTGRVVRNLTGRFIGVRVELYGDRRSTPEIAALRLWGSRFSYVQNYLPELYRENKFSPAADQPGPSTRRDFFERFVDIFEAQLTRIEDRVANSYLLTRPETTPDGALDWLGGWVGLGSAGYPPDRRRARLLAVSKLHKTRGTVKGVTLALDIATNGLCTRGAVIVVEDFRLRHIFATILGANLAIQNDPLLPGYSGSSNSFVGDTLFLGNPRDQAEVLALYSAELPESGTEQAAVQQFYDSLANRMTIFVHNQVETVDINLIQRLVQQEKPAHVAAAVRIATQPFMVGLASLLGVDTYLAPVPPRDPVVLGTSQIGRYNMVIQAPSLDPRLEI
jgi:phage tail-like protein